jgi:3-hydroxymyristoyl/3-hydroxydecanoyl-(acyl carrier protein) dehydratase
MPKTESVAPEPPAESPVQRMPAPPSVLPEVPLPPSTSGSHEPVPSFAVERQHQLVAHSHAEFLRIQEQVHTDFLLHRRRLLEKMEEFFGLERAPAAPALESVEGREPLPVAVEPPTASSVSRSTSVDWGDWFLDSHVVPPALLLASLGDVVSRLQPSEPKRFGVLEFEAWHSSPLPGPGETIVVETRVDEAANRELSFQVDCLGAHGTRTLVSFRGRCSTTIEWPATSYPPPQVAATPQPVLTGKRQFSDSELAALAQGDVFACFGKGFERSASHTRTPPLPGLAVVRLSSVTVFEPAGGGWHQGLLSARVATVPEDAMPTDEVGWRLGRVYQGALQTLAFFAMACGRTVDRDGWRFEPASERPAHLRFMEVPGPLESIDYELVVERVEGGPGGALFGHVKAWAGDALIFQADLGLRLVPDWPLSSDRELQAEGIAEEASGRAAAEIEGFRIGYRSLLAGALGRPSDAFREPGGFFETGERQMPRLPGPPYHFITRVTAVAGERLTMRPGAEATMEYDVPPDAWYFDESGTRRMPFCVLLEAALQPCGWLSVYVGCPLTTTEDVFFRNLDGAGMVVSDEVLPQSGTLRTHAKVISVTRVSGVIILSYRIECSLGDVQVCKLDATFGYFPKEALAMQAGLKTTDEQRNILTAESPARFELAERPDRYFAGPLRLPGPVLLMMDRVSGYWPAGGAAGKGHLRGEKDVKPADWFFKAHFYSDPVQPGSLGLEMMLQLLQLYCIEENLGEDIIQAAGEVNGGAYFEPLARGAPVSWKFRGQVRPASGHVVTDVEIVTVDRQPDSVTVTANGSLWVDGIRCYEAKGIGLRIRGGQGPSLSPGRPPSVVETIVDPGGADRWVADHRPSHTVPVMPMTSMVDRLAGASLAYVRAAYPPREAAPDWVVLGGDDFRAHGWLVCDAVKRLRTEVKLLRGRASTRVDELETSAVLYQIPDAAPPRKVAAGRVRLGRRWPTPPRAWSVLEDATPSGTPYETGAIGHGPALQIIERIAYGPRGATAVLDAGGGSAPVGTLHQVLLDGALQAIPHDELERWSDKIHPGHVGVPVRTTARFFGPPPTRGKVRLELRFTGFDGGAALPMFGIQMIDPEGRVWATLRHVELLVPTGHRTSDRHQRVPFLVEKKYVEGACLSRFYEDRTELADADVKRMDWMPGSVALVYGLPRGAPIDNRVVAIKDHVAHILRVHPAHVRVDAACTEGRCEDPPRRFPVSVDSVDSVEDRRGVVVVRNAPARSS